MSEKKVCDCFNEETFSERIEALEKFDFHNWFRGLSDQEKVSWVENWGNSAAFISSLDIRDGLEETSKLIENAELVVLPRPNETEYPKDFKPWWFVRVMLLRNQLEVGIEDKGHSYSLTIPLELIQKSYRRALSELADNAFGRLGTGITKREYILTEEEKR